MFRPVSASILQEISKEKSILNATDEHFLRRLSANFHTIYELSNHLYGDRYEIKKVLRGFVESMIDGYQSRLPELRKQDLKRTSDSAWFRDQKWVGMMLYVNRFQKDLSGLKKNMSYFDDLGVNLLHLMPLLSCPAENNDGGYAVSDFRSVEPSLGTMEELKSLAKLLRKNQKLLMLDITINHTSNEHAWALKAKAGDKKYQDFYYTYEDRSVPDAFEQALPEVFPDTAPGNFTFVEEMNRWVMTVFHDYQWDLNFTNPEVFTSMFDELAFLVNQGVDIMRLDALAFTWKRIGTDSQNLPEAHMLIQLYKACMQVMSPGTLFLAEAIVAPTEIVKYFGTSYEGSNECDMAYNATLMTVLWEMIATKSNRLYQTTFQNIPSKPPGTTWLNYVRCHDDIGLGYDDVHAGWSGYNPQDHRRFITDFLTGNLDWSFSKGEPFMIEAATGNARISGTLASLAGLEKALESNDEMQIESSVKRILMLHAIILSYGGIPMLYMGDEIGMTNDYSFQNHSATAGDNRWMHRPIFDKEKDKRKSKKGTIEYRIYQKLRRLIEVRKQTTEFADGDNLRMVDARNERLLAYIREDGAYRSFCVFNLNDHPEPLYADVLMQEGFVPKEKCFDRISEQYMDVNQYNVMLQPYQACWISLLA